MAGSLRSALLGLALAGVSLAVAAGQASAATRPMQRFGAGCRRSDFSSLGRPVRAELCVPAAGRLRAAAVVLHGCGGFSTFDHRLATELPHAGVATLDVDYFGLTPPPGETGFCSVRSRKGFAVWPQVVLDAAAHLRGLERGRLPGVSAVGWSLGGGVALAAALRAPTAFRSLVLFSAGGARRLGAAPRSLPPTLGLSAGATDAVPLADMEALIEALRAAGVSASLYVWPRPRGRHDWPGAQGEAGIARAAAFLVSHR